MYLSHAIMLLWLCGQYCNIHIVHSSSQVFIIPSFFFNSPGSCDNSYLFPSLCIGFRTPTDASGQAIILVFCLISHFVPHIVKIDVYNQTDGATEV